jgi:hypothetical protein
MTSIRLGLALWNSRSVQLVVWLVLGSGKDLICNSLLSSTVPHTGGILD